MEFEFYLVAIGSVSGETNPPYVQLAGREEARVAEPSTRTLVRPLALLATICDRGTANLADSARDCDLAPSTALRSVTHARDIRIRHQGGVGTYRPGVASSSWCAGAVQRVADQARQTPDGEVVEKTGESVYLSVEGHRGTALYIGIVEGTHSVRHAGWVGRTVPLDRSAAGHALRGRTPDDRLRGRRTRRRGRCHRDRVPGVLEARIVAALSLVVPTYRLTAEDAARLRPDAHLGRGRRIRPTESFPKPVPFRRTIMITFDNVSKVYPDGTVAVHELTLTAPNGKITTLVGPSGCGIPTSMRMINRLIGAEFGTIELDGVDTQTLDRVALRRRNRVRHPERWACFPIAPWWTTWPPCRDYSAVARRKRVRRQWNCWSVSASTRNSPNGIRGSCPVVSSSESEARKTPAT